MRKSTKMIVSNSRKQVKLTKDELSDYLGRRLFSEEQIYKTARVGVIMGLAYTSLGGATLYIEATSIAGNPGFKQTGQLGGVMVESSEIAYTYVRSLFKDNDKQKAFFNSSFIHLHVPAGATPKDGPSAGITMACAIYSLVVNKPIKRSLAMTGELTLSGLVMPIGGVKEKLIAAKRAKVKHIIFPAENEADFEELDEHIKKGVTPYFVRTFDEVIAIGFTAQRRKRAK
jgi:ATP-dependent Lon protease